MDVLLDFVDIWSTDHFDFEILTSTSHLIPDTPHVRLDVCGRSTQFVLDSLPMLMMIQASDAVISVA